jgi:AAA+ ATPase superfamily predicted ATPase
MNEMEGLAWGTDTELTDKQFYNRETDITLIKTLLETTSTGSPPTIMITGIRGVGKTVLLKKIKNELQKDYLICYLDLSTTKAYQTGKLNENGIMEHFYTSWMQASQQHNFTTITKKVKKYLKTKNFKLKDVINVGGYPIPLFNSENDYQKLSNFVLQLPQSIYKENQKDIKGAIMIIDEFQVLKDLGNNLDSFLWYFRSIIQTQKNVAYVFTGSITSTDNIIAQIAGKNGAFGGRILNIEILPFPQETVETYLKEKIPSLILVNDGFKRFYKCTKGIPHYVNTFAKILPKNTPLDNKKVKNEFRKTLPLLAVHLIHQWGRLTLQEQKIIVKLKNKPLKRKELAKQLKVSTGSLSTPLTKLINLNLIESQGNGIYSISDTILKAWINKEYNEKGIYPYRTI